MLLDIFTPTLPPLGISLQTGPQPLQGELSDGERPWRWLGYGPLLLLILVRQPDGGAGKKQRTRQRRPRGP